MDCLDPYLDLEPESLLTNFNSNELSKYQKAITLSNSLEQGLEIYIVKEAYWRDGTLDPLMHSLHTNSSTKDHSSFWTLLDTLDN